MLKETTQAKLAHFAEDQWGLLTRRQAEAAGISKTTLQRLSDHSNLERVGHGVYRVAGAPLPDHIGLRAAWLQLAPEVPVWERRSEQGVVSYRSAAALYGLGHLPADRHEFTLPQRRQARRKDMRFHLASLGEEEWIVLGGLLVTRPARIVSDLLADGADPEAVAAVIADSLRTAKEYPPALVLALAPHARGLGLRSGDGQTALRWLLDLVGDPQSDLWLSEARGLKEVGITPASLRESKAGRSEIEAGE